MERKVYGIVYEEPGEDFNLGILSESIDREKFCAELNNSIPDFNRDVDEFLVKVSILYKENNLNLTFFEVTGEELLNEREPKFPSTTPSGFKSIQLAYPEITEERVRRTDFNKKNREIYLKHKEINNIKFESQKKPLRDELLKKWPMFKGFFNPFDVYPIEGVFCIRRYNFISND